MANKNTKRAHKKHSKELTALRKAGGQIVNPPSKRGSAWKGVPSKTRPVPATR